MYIIVTTCTLRVYVCVPSALGTIDGDKKLLIKKNFINSSIKMSSSTSCTGNQRNKTK